MTRKHSEALLEHDCNLPKDNEGDVLKQIIDTGIFIGLRRKLCYLKMVNKNHPKTQLHFKSTASRQREELKHLVNHMYMFHPFSLWSLYWEFFIFFVYLYMYDFVTTIVSFLGQLTVFYESTQMRLTTFIGDTILTIDMVYLFFLGYFSSDRSRTILKPSEVAKHYLKTLFFVDFIAAMPSYCLVLQWAHIIKEENNPILNKIHVLMVLRVCRLTRCLRAMELFRQYMNYSIYWFKAIKVVLVYIILIRLLNGAIFYLSPYILQEPDAEYKMGHFYRSILLILAIAHKDIDNSALPTAKNILAITLILCVGYIFQLFLHAHIMQVWKTFTSATSTRDNVLQQFKEYMIYKGLPLRIRERLFTYLKFKFQNEVYYNETKLKSIMSYTLKQEIWLHMTKAKLEKVKFFKGVPEKIILKIAAQLKQAIYLPDDVIVTAGLPGTCMYLIHYGTVAVYTNAGKELCHLEDGEYFGEIALVFNEPRMVTVVAVTPCELFRLKQKDFMNAIEPFPELKSQIIDNARNRILGSRLESF